MIPSFIETYIIQDKKICDGLINYHKKQKEYKSEGYVGTIEGTKILTDVKESTDVVFHNDTKNDTIQNFFKELSTCCDNYVKKYSLNHSIQTEYCNIISMFPPLGGYKSPHYERSTIAKTKRQLVYMLYLNDVNDGGQTEFIHQNLIVKAEKGKLVLWPSDFTHLHRGIVSPTETKWIATGWLELIF